MVDRAWPAADAVLPWPPMTSEEEDAREAEALARKLRIRRRLAVLVPLLLLAAPFIWFSVRVGQHEAREQERAAADALDDGEIAALRTALDQADERARAALRGWQEGVTLAALDGWRPAGSRCAAGIDPPTRGAGESYVEHGSIDGNYFGRWSYRLVEGDGGGEAIAPAAALTGAAATIDGIRQRLAAGEADRGDLQRAERLASGRAWSREALVVVRVDERREPLFIRGGANLDSFEPGVIRGRAYAIDVGAQRVLCVGDVAATNSPVIDFSYLSTSPLDETSKRSAAESTLARDLEVELRRAIAASLEVAALA